MSDDPKPFGNIGGVDVVTLARKLITMRRAGDAGGISVDTKAMQKWQREAYLSEELVLVKLLERIAELERRSPSPSEGAAMVEMREMLAALEKRWPTHLAVDPLAEETLSRARALLSKLPPSEGSSLALRAPPKAETEKGEKA